MNRIAALLVAFAVVLVIGLSQRLADWWGGGNSGYRLLDGPLSWLRSVHSVFDAGWLHDGLGVHVVMWCVVAIVVAWALQPVVPVVLAPILFGLMASIGIVIELLQYFFTLRNASLRDITGNLIGLTLAWSAVGATVLRGIVKSDGQIR